jgi:prepilin-type N-terminal cleavage/methylation domain-containing protein
MWERMKEKRNEGGFTLIELLIVIIILAILAAIVVFAVGTTGTNAKVAACNSDAKSVETAVEAYKAQTGTYPISSTQLLTSTGTTGSWLRSWPSSANSYTIALDPSTAGTVDVNGSNYDGATNPCSGV